MFYSLWHGLWWCAMYVFFGSDILWWCDWRSERCHCLQLFGALLASVFLWRCCRVHCYFPCGSSIINAVFSFRYFIFKFHLVSVYVFLRLRLHGRQMPWSRRRRWWKRWRQFCSVCGVIIQVHSHLLHAFDCYSCKFLASDVNNCILNIYLFCNLCICDDCLCI